MFALLWAVGVIYVFHSFAKQTWAMRDEYVDKDAAVVAEIQQLEAQLRGTGVSL